MFKFLIFLISYLTLNDYRVNEIGKGDNSTLLKVRFQFNQL